MFHRRFQCRCISLLTRYHFNVFKDDVTDDDTILVQDQEMPEVERTKVVIDSRAGRIRDVFAANHKDACDVFQAALSGVKDQNGGSVLQKLVDDNIPSFPSEEKISQLLDAYEAANDAMLAELQFSAAYHNASLQVMEF